MFILFRKEGFFIKVEFFKKAVSAMLAVIMIFFCVPSAFAITVKDAYEYGAVLVSLHSGSESVINGLLVDFDVESVSYITPGSTTQNVYHVRFTEKTKEIVWEAIAVLKNSPYVKYAEPNYYGEYLPVDEPVTEPATKPATDATEPVTEVPEPITDMVKGDVNGDGRSTTQNVYHVRFTEKTKEIVWEAIAVLKNSPYVKYAEPNYYGEYLPVDEPVTEPATKPATDATEPVTEVPEPITDMVKGDVNGDGILSMLDALAIQSFLAKLCDLNEQQLLAADTDGNDLISIDDATMVQKRLAGFAIEFGSD